jgi:protein-S-isoprenylcysteine O-methyltransferase Ste14
MNGLVTRLARWRVPLGFLCGLAALALARPSSSSWWIGAGIAVVGEAIRVWAAGHLERWRAVAQSGPYRFMRHPLYVGSSILAIGFVVAAQQWAVAAVAFAYMAATLSAAVRFEAAELTQTFGGAYKAYRAGAADASGRSFSWARVVANREYRAAIGAVVVFAFLFWRAGR